MASQQNGAITQTLVVAAARKRRMWWQDFFGRLFAQKLLGTIGLVILIIVVVMAVFAPLIAPYGFREQHLSEAFQNYRAKYFLGTDQLGRDLFSRIVFGARISMTVALASVFFSLILSIFLGLTTGYIGGRYDVIVQRVVDAFMTFPWIVFLLLMMAILGPGMRNVILALSLEAGIQNSRIVRGEVMAIKENYYIDAARALGVSPIRIMLRHILPNTMAPLIVIGTVSLGNFIFAEASLSFLGFGVPPPNPTWGGMLSGSGVSYMYRAPWLALWPGVALSMTIFAVNMFGDAMRDLLDPRLRGGK